LPGLWQIAADKGHNQQGTELEMRISDKENNELRELEEQLQGAYKQIGIIYQKKADDN